MQGRISPRWPLGIMLVALVLTPPVEQASAASEPATENTVPLDFWIVEKTAEAKIENIGNVKQDNDKAVADFADASRFKPDDPNAYVFRGLALLNNGEIDKAFSNFGDASRINRDNPGCATAYGGDRLGRTQKKVFENAVVDLTEAIRLDLDHVNAFAACGPIFFVKNQFDQAGSDLDPYVRLSSQQPADYLMGAEVRQARHEYHQVIADCAAALLLEPGTADAHQLRADAWTCQHPFDTAIFDCTEVLPLTPNDAGLLDARPDDLFQEQDFGGLIACSTAAIAIDAEGLLAYQLRASARTRKCEFDNAIADHGQVMILDPKNADAFVRLACNEQEKMEDVDAAATRAYLTGNSSEMKGLKADFDVPIVPTLIPPLTNTNGATIDIAVAPSTRVLVVESAPIEILTDVASAKKQIMATLGSELATGDASSTYDNLAADNASAGDFAAAVLAEAVAIAQCNDQIKKAEYGARLKQYQEKKW